MGLSPKPAKGKAKPAVSRKSPKNEDSKVRDLEQRLAEALGQLQTRDRELGEALKREAEALEQQTATSEILRVISSSPTDIQPVFDAIVRSAAHLCDGVFAALHRFDGERLHWEAQHNFTEEGLELMRRGTQGASTGPAPRGEPFWTEPWFISGTSRAPTT